MHLVFGHDATVWQWAEARAGQVLQPHLAVGIVDRQGTLRGCFLLHEVTPHTAELSVYAEATLTPNVIRAIFSVPFNHLGYGRLQTTVAKDNSKAKKENPRWGFKFEGTARDFFGEKQDGLRYAMLKRDCKFIRSGKREEVYGTV
jgi:RimJ/RimL family protein N-acetyltransferase